MLDIDTAKRLTIGGFNGEYKMKNVKLIIDGKFADILIDDDLLNVLPSDPFTRSNYIAKEVAPYLEALLSQKDEHNE